MSTLRASVATRQAGISKNVSRRSLTVTASQAQPKAPIQAIRDITISLAASVALTFHAGPAAADSNMRLPPLDPDPARCERAFVGNTIGQANAVSDRLLDLRMCDFSGKDLRGKTLSGALMVETNFSKANMQEVVMSKAYAVSANLTGADLTNAVVDRVVFDKADLTGVQFVNTVITGATFNGTNLTGANFEDALIGNEDAKRLCQNPTLTGESRIQVGCRS